MKNPSPNSDISNMATMTAELLVISAEDLDIRAITKRLILHYTTWLSEKQMSAAVEAALTSTYSPPLA